MQRFYGRLSQEPTEFLYPFLRTRSSQYSKVFSIRTFLPFFFKKPTRCVSHKSRFPSCCSRLSLLAPYPRTPMLPSEGAKSQFGTSSHLPYGNIEESSSRVDPSRSVFTQKKKAQIRLPRQHAQLNILVHYPLAESTTTTRCSSESPNPTYQQ
jgi:hypothetical protein